MEELINIKIQLERVYRYDITSIKFYGEPLPEIANRALARIEALEADLKQSMDDCNHLDKASNNKKCHIPKGSMCRVCAKANDDCSRLEFKKMKPLEFVSNRIVVVRCGSFNKIKQD